MNTLIIEITGTMLSVLIITMYLFTLVKKSRNNEKLTIPLTTQALVFGIIISITNTLTSLTQYQVSIYISNAYLSLIFSSIISGTIATLAQILTDTMKKKSKMVFLGLILITIPFIIMMNTPTIKGISL